MSSASLRISSRFTLVVVVAGIVLFGSSAVYQIDAERRDLRGAVQRELGLIGRSLTVFVESALRDGQTADISTALAELDRVDPDLEIYVVDRDGSLLGSSPGTAAPPPRATWPGRGHVDLDPPGALERAVFVAPLSLEGVTRGHLIVVRPLEDVASDLARTQLAIVVTSLVYLVLTAIGVFLAGEVYIGRPVRRLIEAMRRFAAGEPMRIDSTSPRGELQTLAAAYARLQDTLDAAERRVKAGTHERRILQAALQRADKLATVGQLGAGLAHEIGSPLQVLHGRLHALLAHAHDPDRVRRNARISLEQSARITRVVRQLLAITRSNPTRSEHIDVTAAVQAIVDFLGHEAERHEVALALVVQDVPPLLVDPDPIQQLVLNLVSNALAATRAGGRVTVGLSLAASEGGRAVRLTVDDTGCGMSTDLLQRAFEPFFTTHAEDGGTGLGLAVVRTIVDANGGALEVDSQPGGGTRVCIALPVERLRGHASGAA